MYSDHNDLFPKESVSTTVLLIYEPPHRKQFSAFSLEFVTFSAHISIVKASLRSTLQSYKVVLQNPVLQSSS